MSWNIELALVQVAETEPLRTIVPDVFEPTDHVVCFEDAASVMRGTDLSASWVKGWGVVIDITCRLSVSPYLVETSAGREMFVVRITDQPLVVHYRDGELVENLRGVTAILESFGSAKRKRSVSRHGESVAVEWLKQCVGLQFTDDFIDLLYQVFVLP